MTRFRNADDPLDGMTYRLDDVIALACAVIAAHGWSTSQPRAQRYDREPVDPTYVLMRVAYSRPDASPYFAAASQLLTTWPGLVDDVRAYVASDAGEEAGGAVNTLRRHLDEWDRIEPAGFSLVAAAVGAYNSHYGLPGDHVEQATYDHDAPALAAVGDRTTFVGVITAKRPILNDGLYPSDAIWVTLRDEATGARVRTRSTAQWARRLDVGAHIELSAHVTEHTPHQGHPTTFITRATPVKDSPTNATHIDELPALAPADASAFSVGDLVRVGQEFGVVRATTAKMVDVRLCNGNTTYDKRVRANRVESAPTDKTVPGVGDYVCVTFGPHNAWCGTVTRVDAPFVEVTANQEPFTFPHTFWCTLHHLTWAVSAMQVEEMAVPPFVRLLLAGCDVPVRGLACPPRQEPIPVEGFAVHPDTGSEVRDAMLTAHLLNGTVIFKHAAGERGIVTRSFAARAHAYGTPLTHIVPLPHGDGERLADAFGVHAPTTWAIAPEQDPT